MTPAGLSAAEAARRLAAEGPNRLEEVPPPSLAALFARQFRGLVIWVLLGAAAVSLALRDWPEAIAIVGIVLLNAVVGVSQERRAESALAALRTMTAPRARVVRDGHSVMVPSETIVRGDLLVVEAGDVVAADAEVVESADLHVNEAIVTGESLPVRRREGDRLLAGTAVTRGQGRAVVTATGMATEMGRIARMIETAGQDATPLQRRLDAVSRHLVLLAGGIVAVVFVLGVLRGVPLVEMVLAALSLAVAAIPEGLPAVVTLALAVGVQRMARRRALVRRLPAVETLGSAQLVATDKTGTLTVGRLEVRRTWTPDGDARRLLHAAAACNDAELNGDVAVGDPTETALLVAAAALGIDRRDIEAAEPRVGEVPFDSSRKRMAVGRRTGGAVTAYVKGAPEVILPRCTGAPADAAATVDAFARDALRVLAVAVRDLPGGVWRPEEADRDLTLVGLVGLADAPRPEAADAVARCRAAGVRVVMITGDHPATAAAVAREVGILEEGDEVLTGADLDRLDEAGLDRAIGRAAVFARVLPEHKLRIVRAVKRAGLVVAMTGDGVNDAPAVREASVGIAMGSGTEVTKQAADIVVTDDNFASIVNAIEEGRRIFDNIKKTLLYLLAGNAGEILVMLLAALVGLPLPLLPVQILWVNLVTDGLPALALATERVEPEALTRPPRRLDDGFADARFVRRLVLAGAAIGLVSLLGFWLGYRSSGDADEGRSLAFAVLVVSHVIWALAARSWTRVALGPALFTNARLLAVVVGTLVLQVLVESVPAVAAFLGVDALDLDDWLLAGGLGLVPAVAVDLSKGIERWRASRETPRLRRRPFRGTGPGRRAAAPPEAGGTRPPSDRG